MEVVDGVVVDGVVVVVVVAVVVARVSCESGMQKINL
jgi:hypothetical protein